MAEIVHKMARVLTRIGIEPDGSPMTALPGLTVMRHEQPGPVRQEVYTPVLCLVLEGAKQVALGDEVHQVEAGQALLVSVEVPVTARVQASAERPYLAVAVDLDIPLLDEIAEQAGFGETADAAAGAITVLAEPGDRLLDCLGRIVALAENEREAAILLPGLRRELQFLLLLGPLGPALRQTSRLDGRHRRIGRAVALLRSAFHEPLPIEALARAAGMGPSAFHQHFKAVTTYSPRQYQKRLRLLEARRLIRAEGASARNAAFRVGYASPQQFTRDHAKRFGAPTRRDLLGEPKVAAAAE